MQLAISVVNWEVESLCPAPGTRKIVLRAWEFETGYLLFIDSL